MDMSATKRAALEAAYEPPVFVGASRQHSRAMARRAFKTATSPGLHVKKRGSNPKAVMDLLRVRKGTACRRVRYLDGPPPPRPFVKYDAWLHPTKGHRCQLVAA